MKQFLMGEFFRDNIITLRKLGLVRANSYEILDQVGLTNELIRYNQQFLDYTLTIDEVRKLESFMFENRNHIHFLHNPNEYIEIYSIISVDLIRKADENYYGFYAKTFESIRWIIDKMREEKQ